MMSQPPTKTGGRKKGSPNKVTRELREAVLNTFEMVGGEEYLANVARNDPRTFCALLGRVLPTQVQAQVSPDGDELIRRLNAGRVYVVRGTGTVWLILLERVLTSGCG